MCFGLTEPEQSRLGFTLKFREEGMAQSGTRLNWFDLSTPSGLDRPDSYGMYLQILGANRGIEKSPKGEHFFCNFFTGDLTLYVSDFENEQPRVRWSTLKVAQRMNSELMEPSGPHSKVR